MANEKLNVVLCWHMHQPWYRDGLDGAYRLPWVYLHALKDYSDMAAHLERHPRMRVVVNFAPVLLEQLDDYAQQLQHFLADGRPMQDRMLNLLAGIEPIPADTEGRRQLIEDCQRCHAPRMIHPYPAFKNLLDMIPPLQESAQSTPADAQILSYLSDQYFLDLLTWYHLGWLGQSIKGLPAAKALYAHANQYGPTERKALLSIMHACLAGIIPRYRTLAQQGQIELSMTPYMHPIIPLLQDFKAQQCATPDAPAPESSHYPDGHARAHWHMQRGIEVFQHYFGQKPQGVWLSEGGISESALDLLDEFGIRWTASGEGVWRNSCRLSGYTGEDFDSKRKLFMPYQHEQQHVRTFFRDDGLSDLIGFKYSTWHARDAVADFALHLENIGTFLGSDQAKQVVSVILDGENAWEYYPENGEYFLDTLYKELSQSQKLHMTTFAEVCSNLPAIPLPRVCAGSWVYGSFSTWIGSEDKNRGWDYLVAAKQAFDQVAASGKLNAIQLEEATRQLAVCEGSDWFWWFGDYNPAGSVRDFEGLYRVQLGKLYSLLGLDKPAHLDIPLSRGGSSAENAGTMRRNT